MKVVELKNELDLTKDAEAFVGGIQDKRVTDFAIIWYEHGVETPYFTRSLADKNSIKMIGSLELLKASLVRTFVPVDDEGYVIE